MNRQRLDRLLSAIVSMIRLLLPAFLLAAGFAFPHAAVYAAPDAPPIAVPDDRFNQPVGLPVVIDVVTNDLDGDGGGIDPTTVLLVNPANLSEMVTEVVIEGEGIWRVGNSTGDITAGDITFFPDISCGGVFRDEPLPMEYKVSDFDGQRSNPAIMAIAFNPDSTAPPLVLDDEAGTLEGQAVTIDVLANDCDPDGALNPGSVSVFDSPSKGSANANGDGTIIYSPNPGATGSDTFQYQVCDLDPKPQCDTATVTVTVTPLPLNEPPIVVNDGPVDILFNQAAVIDVLVNDSDPDGELDKDSVTITTAAGHGVAVPFTDGSGAIIYTPTDGYSGNDQFAYQVCDDGIPAPVKCGEATVFLRVLPSPNRAPIANDDQAETRQNRAVPIPVLSNDFDAENALDPASVQVTDAPAGGQLSINTQTGTITYTPNADFVGIDIFKYTVCDLATTPLCSNEATVTVNVLPPSEENEAYAFNDAAFVRAGESVVGNVLNNDLDPEGDGWQAPTIKTPPSQGSVDLGADGTFIYTATVAFIGDDVWTYRVCDLGLPEACAGAEVLITVGPANNRPIAADDRAVTRVDTAVSGNVLVNDADPDGDILSVVLPPTVEPASGQVVLAADGQFTYTPDPGATGPDTFTYQVCDPYGLCDTADVIVDIRALNMANAAPYAADDRAITRPETPITIVVLANDGDLDGTVNPGAVAIVEGPDQGTAAVNADGTIIYTPANGVSEAAGFVYRACDNGAPVLCTTATVTVEIVAAGPNTTYAFHDTAWGRSEQKIRGNVLANDLDPEGDGQRVDLNSTLLPNHGQLSLAVDGSFAYTSKAGYIGLDQFTYRVCDDGTPQSCATAVAALQVFPPNLGWDFGDTSDFPSALSANGPRHAIVAGLSFGNVVDPEANSAPNSSATTDDLTDLDDETIISGFPAFVGNGMYRLEVPVTNLTPYPAQLVGWIDWDADFGFDGPFERSLPTLTVGGLDSAETSGVDTFAMGNVPAGYNGLVTLTWAGIRIPVAPSATKVMRLRLAGNMPGSADFFSAAGPTITGPATGGAVVDMVAPIATRSVNIDTFTAMPVGEDSDVAFAWSTTFEYNIAGFNLLVARAGVLTPVNDELIPSEVTNSITTVNYGYTGRVEGDDFYLQVVTASGETFLVGPARLDVIPPPTPEEPRYFLPLILSKRSLFIPLVKIGPGDESELATD